MLLMQASMRRAVDPLEDHILHHGVAEVVGLSTHWAPAPSGIDTAGVLLQQADVVLAWAQSAMPAAAYVEDAAGHSDRPDSQRFQVDHRPTDSRRPQRSFHPSGKAAGLTSAQGLPTKVSRDMGTCGHLRW
eukprot:CAMPEP_0169334684 /NCGR_PEP_ID=MMETSP1017-20121227/15924_1 /TAXON_ID=342587 /ORGANISM="Karlodinium micrum, Strain CCMP2283" /LENGTH=130 /DNA_ID=CAMNT_0009429989 /DNA_START=699 /DNA_END=1091 /DNA_ORIENTATION=+